jgi:hypothetical protein
MTSNGGVWQIMTPVGGLWKKVLDIRIAWCHTRLERRCQQCASHNTLMIILLSLRSGG